MTISKRSILGPSNPGDGGPANYVDGRQPDTTGTPEHHPVETLGATHTARESDTANYREAQAFTSRIDNDNTAGGVQLGRGPDTFTTTPTPRKA